MEALTHRRDARNHRALAPGRLPNVLEADFEGSKVDWEKADTQGGSRVDLSNGSRESDVGCAPHSGRTAHARFRHLETNDLPLEETCS
jgi:hypothetical protein